MKQASPLFATSLMTGVMAMCVMGTVLGGCAVTDRSSGEAPALSKADGLAMAPLANNTETPQAGQRAVSIAQTLMTSYGYSNVMRYPASADDETLFDPAKPDRQQAVLAWAQKQNARYLLTGSVNEWRYKVGVDGEPAVALTFEIIDVETGKLIWSSSGSRTGWSRDAVAGVAQKLERSLLQPLAH